MRSGLFLNGYSSSPPHKTKFLVIFTVSVMMFFRTAGSDLNCHRLSCSDVQLRLATATWLLPGPRRVGHSFLDIHTLLYAVVAILTGFQAVVFALFTNVFGITEGLLPEDPRLTRAFRTLTLERGLLLGTTLLLVGVGVASYSAYTWSRSGFGPMNPFVLVRLVAAALVSITLGVEIIFSSFFLSILSLARR